MLICRFSLRLSGNSRDREALRYRESQYNVAFNNLCVSRFTLLQARTLRPASLSTSQLVIQRQPATTFNVNSCTFIHSISPYQIISNWLRQQQCQCSINQPTSMALSLMHSLTISKEAKIPFFFLSTFFQFYFVSQIEEERSLQLCRNLFNRLASHFSRTINAH